MKLYGHGATTAGELIEALSKLPPNRVVYIEPGEYAASDGHLVYYDDHDTLVELL